MLNNWQQDQGNTLGKAWERVGQGKRTKVKAVSSHKHLKRSRTGLGKYQDKAHFCVFQEWGGGGGRAGIFLPPPLPYLCSDELKRMVL